MKDQKFTAEMGEKITKSQAKLNDFADNLLYVKVHTLEGLESMHSLLFFKKKPKEFKRFYCDVEVFTGEAGASAFKVVRKYHSFGVVFEDGFELCNVDKKILKLFPDLPVIDCKKRLF